MKEAKENDRRQFLKASGGAILAALWVSLLWWVIRPNGDAGPGPDPAETHGVPKAAVS